MAVKTAEHTKPRSTFVTNLEHSARLMEADTQAQVSLVRDWWATTTRGGTRRPTQENVDELLRHISIVGGKVLGLSPNILVVLQEDDSPTFRTSMMTEGEQLSPLDKFRELGSTVFSADPDIELRVEEVRGMQPRPDITRGLLGDLTEMPGLDTAARFYE